MSALPGSLSSIPLLEASDAEGAHNHIAAVYIPHRLVPQGTESLAFKLAHFDSPRITFGHVTYGADAELFCPAMENSYHLNLTLAGTTQVQQGKKFATTSAGFGAAFDSDEPYRVKWSADAVQYAMKLSHRAIDDQLAALLGRPAPRALHFDLNFDLTETRGHGLLSAAHHLRSQYAMMCSLGDVPHPLLVSLESYILTQILFAVPHTFTDILRCKPAELGRSYVRKAIHLMEERASEPWTLEDLAREMCVSVRGLQSGFRKELDTTPMQYLREVRLRRAREDLLSTPGVRVSEVASRWGFYHFGRFAQIYRERFGESPSAVLVRDSS